MTKNQLSKDIELAKSIIEENAHNKNKNAQSPNYFLNLYAFTNENLSGCLQNCSFSSSQVLTLGSSADQIFNFTSRNALDITLLDINPFTKYYYDLKKSAILNLSRDAYLDFFSQPSFNLTNHHSNSFNEQDYYKLSLYLSKESKIFWDTLFNTYSNKFIRKYLFMKNELPKKHLIINNPYLLPDNYQKLPLQIEKSHLHIIEDNVLNIANHEKNYDIIYLSNVLDYLFSFYFTKLDNNEYKMHPDVANKYLSFINEIINKLNPQGTLFFHYMWDINNYYYRYYSSFDKVIIPNKNFSKLIFPGSNHFPNEKDSIYVYKKIK